MKVNLKQLELIIESGQPFELLHSSVCKSGSLNGPCSTCVFKTIYNYERTSMGQEEYPLINSMFCCFNIDKFVTRYHTYLKLLDAIRLSTGNTRLEYIRDLNIFLDNYRKILDNRISKYKLINQIACLKQS